MLFIAKSYWQVYYSEKIYDSPWIVKYVYVLELYKIIYDTYKIHKIF